MKRSVCRMWSEVYWPTSSANRVPSRDTPANEKSPESASVLIVSLTVFLSYRFSSRLIAYLGETGTVVFLRLSSFILLCIGVAIIWSGVVDLVQPLLQH